MAMNIYGRPMFQGGSIRMAPSIKPLPRYQNGGRVKPHHALHLEKYQDIAEDDKVAVLLNIDSETGAFVNPEAAYKLLRHLASTGMDIRDFLPQDSNSQYRSIRDEQFRNVSPLGDRYKESWPTEGSGATLEAALRPVGEKISQEWHSRRGKTPPYEFPQRWKPNENTEPAPDYSPNISADIYEDQTPDKIYDFIDTSETVSVARGGPIRRQVGGGIEAVMPEGLGALVEQPPMPMPAPPPMPMPAPPPGIDEALPQVEQAAQNVGEQEGAQYAMEVMSGLDAAEESGDPEQAINALRGNEMPISGRYEELATYVGDDDAERTPESVLLMVQPTIMLTEQGAMDSGIGSLMENVVGDIDMETAQGAPTAMGEGVGSLMMAQADTGVGQEPPVNFNYGGPVQRFNGEFGSEVRKAAKERSALLSEMIGLDKQAALDQEALDSLRNTTKAQTWFDIAQAGLNLAAGDPSKSFAENFAISAAPVAANLSARGGAFAKEERDLDKLRRAQAQKINLSAAESAIKEINERKAAEAAWGEKAISKLYNVTPPGGVTTQRSVNNDQYAKLKNQGATIKEIVEPKKPEFVYVLNKENKREFFNITDAKQAKAAQEAANASNSLIYKLTTEPDKEPKKPEFVYVLNKENKREFFDITDLKQAKAAQEAANASPSGEMYEVGKRPADKDEKLYYYANRVHGWKLMTEAEAAADPKDLVPGLVVTVGRGAPEPRALLSDPLTSRGFLKAADSTDKILDVYVGIATDLILNAGTKQPPINVEISAEGVSPTAQRPKEHRFLRAAKKILNRDYLTQNKIVDKTGAISKNVGDLNKDEVTTLVNLYFPNVEAIQKIIEEPLPSKMFGALKTTFGALWPSQAGGENVENRNAIKLFDHMWKQYIYQNLPRLSKPERLGMADLFTGLWPTLQKTPTDAKKYIGITLIPQLNNYIKHMTDRINAMNEEDKNTVEETLTLRQLRAMREPWLQYIAGKDNESKAFDAKSDAVRKKEREQSGFYGPSKNPNNTGSTYIETEQFNQMREIGTTQ